MQKTKKTYPVPSVLAMHDLSCLGRCSLSAVTPVLSAMGVQVIPLPTALLSSQTDGVEGYYFRDLSPDLVQIARHFIDLSLHPQAICSGFAASPAQCELLSGIFDAFGTGALKLVDPVLGDGGALYASCEKQMIPQMRKVCAHADLLTPNLTEACLLTEISCADTAGLSAVELKSYIGRLFDALCDLGAPRAVITGIPTGDGRICTAGIDRTAPDAEPFYTSVERVEGSYPGTGDLFASVLLGKLLFGASLSSAAEAASSFVQKTVAFTAANGGARENGVCFEPFLCELGQR